MNKTEFIAWASNEAEYKGFTSTNRKLADEALVRAYDWYNTQPKGFQSKKSLRKSRKECKAYLKEHYNPQPTEFGYSSVFVSWIFYLILNSVINWVIRRLLDDWIFKK